MRQRATHRTQSLAPKRRKRVDPRSALLALVGLIVAGPQLAAAQTETAPEAFSADTPVLHQEAESAGISHVYDGPWEFFVGGGGAAFDCDGDARPELYAAGGANPATLFRNRSGEGVAFAADTPGALALTDDGLRRREVALIAGRDDREGLELLSPLHYLEKALEPNADLLQGALGDILPANPDVVVLADVATLAPAEEEALLAWVEKGGLLLRFAGPRLAASDVSRAEEDTLMPASLRAGDQMRWIATFLFTGEVDGKVTYYDYCLGWQALTFATAPGLCGGPFGHWQEPER